MVPYRDSNARFIKIKTFVAEKMSAGFIIAHF